MIKGAMFTIGILASVGSVGLGAIIVGAAAMSDVPQSGAPDGFYACCGGFAVGVGLIAAACFIK